MRKIVAGLFLSLDGVMEAPEKWHFSYFNDEMGEAVASQMAESDTLLLGRRTYEEFAAFWPRQSRKVPLASAMNDTPKVVVSTTLNVVEWQNSTLISRNVMQELAALKQQPGRNISITGSATLVLSLLRDHLLDELRLLIHPIIVGSGRHLFPEGTTANLIKLVDSTTFSAGVLSLTYQPADSGQPTEAS